MEDNLVDTKKLIKQTLIQRIGVMLESKIEEVAPSMISERKTSDPAPESKENKENQILKKKRAVTDFAKKDKKLDEEYELFVDEIQEIVEEIEEETGEELSDEEIKTLGEQYLKYISEETT